MRQRWLAVVLLGVVPVIAAPSTPQGVSADAKRTPQVNSFQVVELRRYTITAGGREHFAEYFETYFPEAFQQVGAIVLGQFFERANDNHFLWLRAFRDMDERAKANAVFYYGPVWKEHRSTLNALIEDSDNVLLLHPCQADRPVMLLPAVDPVTEPEGATGRAVAVIYPVKASAAEQFARDAESIFAQFRAAGVREAGLLCSLNAVNNFPQLPIRADGPFVVWLGVVPDEGALKNTFVPLEESSRNRLGQTQQLTGPVELVVLTPTKRSRLRWVNPE